MSCVSCNPNKILLLTSDSDDSAYESAAIMHHMWYEMDDDLDVGINLQMLLAKECSPSRETFMDALMMLEKFIAAIHIPSPRNDLMKNLSSDFKVADLCALIEVVVYYCDLKTLKSSDDQTETRAFDFSHRE